VLANRSQIIAIPLACLFVGRVPGRALVHGIKVQLEELVRFLAVVVWIAKKSPAFQQPAIPQAVRDSRIVLVVGLIERFAGPFLYVLRIWPVWPVAVRDRFLHVRPGLSCQSASITYSPVQVMPKSMPTMKSGFHSPVDIVRRISRNALY
jgi:hypothetical protein